ncbi:MAG: rod shape-determining protein [Actinobacteria bacterium]|nr:rod shape-determining protein [Actinomycetota bacterium]
MAGRDLAIDLGTANTLVYRQGQGIIFNQPTVIAVNSRTGEVLSMGDEAWEMIGRTPGHVVAIRPLRHGAITDFDLTHRMIRHIFQRVGVPRFPKPRVLICVPSAITDVERRAVTEAASSAGARAVTLVEQPLAAAIGAGLPIHEPVGNLVVDVGGGTSEMAVVSMGGIVAGTSIRVGGFDMDAAIQHHVRRTFDVAVGEKTAEQLKIAIGSAYPAADIPNAAVRGRELSTGMPTEIEVTEEEVREALSHTVSAIVESTRRCLAESPPELGHDVLETGIFLTGGGGLLRGIDMRLSQECEVPVHLTESPLETVVAGAGRMLDSLPEFRSTGLFARGR